MFQMYIIIHITYVYLKIDIKNIKYYQYISILSIYIKRNIKTSMMIFFRD